MASIHRDKNIGIWMLMFRWNGRQYRRSCRTRDRTAARDVEARVGETIRLLKLGRLDVPAGAEPATWILTDGKHDKRRSAQNPDESRFGQVCENYVDDQIGKAESTRKTEQVHIRHLTDVLGERTPIETIDFDEIQRYAKVRDRDKCRGRGISGKTIRMELATFRQI